MDFQESNELDMIRSTATEIASEYGPEYWREKDAAGEYPEEYFDALGEAGFTGLLIDEEYGGAGMGMEELAVAIQTLCAEGTGLAGVWNMIAPIAAPVAEIQFGTEEQKERFLPMIANNEQNFCVGITEPEAGTNTLNVDTFAERDGDEYVINGNKCWITFPDRSDYIVLVTRTTPFEEATKTNGISMFVVDLDDPGIEISTIPKHGFNYTNSCEVFFDDVRVPAENLLGEEDKGWEVLLGMLNPERIGFAAGVVGAGRLAANTAIDYANEREVFDGPIGQYQSIQHPIAEGWAQLEAAELLARKAAWQFDQGKQCGYEANTAKAVAIEAGHHITYHAMQTFGGWGYAKEYDVERYWREMNLTRLAPVTQQMAYNHIAQEIGFPRSY